MNREDIIRMAREAGISNSVAEYYWIELGRMIAAEREACAVLCDNRSSFYWNWNQEDLQKHTENRHYAIASEECANAIRARG